MVAVPIKDLDDRERAFFTSWMPQAVAAVAVGYHVVTTEEWTWVQSNKGSERCDADDHVLAVCADLKRRLGERGFQSQIIDYPGESGLQFRAVAQAAGLGQIGTSAFLLHPNWGPWIHLRVIATTAPLGQGSSGHTKNVCTACNRCIDACPARAITKDGFDGLRCRAYRKKRGEYTPVGEARVYHFCLTCAQVCPVGKRPRAK